MNTSDVLNRLTYHRRSQVALVQHLKEEEPKLGDKLEGCGTWLLLREWLQTGRSKIQNANFCKRYLLCQSCAARRAMKQVVAYRGKVECVQEARPELIPAMITLTIKNRDCLPEGLDHLKGSFGRMMAAKRKGKSGSSRNGLLEWNKVLGAVRSIEVTKKDKGWHPHIHAFCLLEDYVDQKKLSEEWHRFTGDSFVVGVKRCDNGIVPGLIECLKYVSKLADLSPQNTLEVHRSARGARFTDSQGLLRGVPEPDITEDDDDENCVGPYRDFMALWGFQSGSYHLQDYRDPAKKLGFFKPGDIAYPSLPSALGLTGF